MIPPYMLQPLGQKVLYAVIESYGILEVLTWAVYFFQDLAKDPNQIPDPWQATADLLEGVRHRIASL